MLSHEMFLFDRIRRRSNPRIDQLGTACHLCHFLKYNRIMNRLRSILAPGERSVIRAEHCRYVYWIDASLLEGLNDDKTGILLLLAIDLFRSQASRTRNRSIHIICMCGSVARNVSAGLRP